MAKQLFVNLPVKDLDKTMAFFASLGFTFNKQFTNEHAACMVISDTNYVMLLTEPFFKGFMKKEIADTRITSEVIVALSADSREEVDTVVKKAMDAGATKYAEPNDHGFMYQHSFQDLDGHLWEVFWMDPTAVNQPQEELKAVN
jgi:uncharacterized protein